MMGTQIGRQPVGSWLPTKKYRMTAAEHRLLDFQLPPFDVKLLVRGALETAGGAAFRAAGPGLRSAGPSMLVQASARGEALS